LWDPRGAVLRQYTSSDIKNYDLEQIVLDRAIIIAKQCNPRTGSLQGIEQVQFSLEKIEDMLLLRDEKTLAKVQEIIGAGVWSTAEEALARSYALTPHVTTAFLDYFPWSGGTLPPRCAFFLGSMIQDQPIFGDVILEQSDYMPDDSLDTLAPEISKIGEDRFDDSADERDPFSEDDDTAVEVEWKEGEAPDSGSRWHYTDDGDEDVDHDPLGDIPDDLDEW